MVNYRDLMVVGLFSPEKCSNCQHVQDQHDEVDEHSYVGEPTK